MFSTTALNHKTNRLHERGLRALLNDDTPTFNGIVSKGDNANIHVKNIKKLMIKFHKYLYRLLATIIKEVFRKRTVKYNLQNSRVTLLPNPKIKKYDTGKLAYKANQLWSTLPKRYKNLSLLDLFKSEMKNWNRSDCSCSICRKCIDGVGFIN